ncbi:MAG: LicD family protein [Oscillospiraceae bacterium]|jgi:lipopolysaccharide cholinephosphotransferase|nr:LicD family protein [Oscillospiraceae bacterium]
MPNLTELQTVELDLLRRFTEVAELECLSWFAMFGTLLGAVRHGGFIPWDDDIDVVLPRADYDRLRNSPDWFAEPYFLQTPANDPAAAPPFTRLRHSGTTVLIDFPNGLTRGGNMGAYIDIIPLDDVPDGETAAGMQKAAEAMRGQLLASAALDECAGGAVSAEKEFFCYCSGGIAGGYAALAERYERFCARYAGTKQPYCAMPVCRGERGARVYEKAWFGGFEPKKFGDLTVRVPIGWEKALVAAYPGGTLTPEPKYRTPKHTENAVVDMSRPYTHYTRRYFGMLSGIEGKNVYIFGAGDSLRIWLERYGAGLNVVCAFDNSERKRGTSACGIPVRGPDELPGLLRSDGGARLIIASVHYEEISKQLDTIGVTGYFVFIDGLRYERG